jgi:exodeoxyribonuclease VII large subunit
MNFEIPILSVSQLNQQIRTWLEQNVGPVRVEGEVSNLSKPVSGHFYFSLKDNSAQLRCVFFKNRHAHGDGEKLKNGQKLILKGQLSLYEARGDYQLIVESIEEAGHGDLHLQFEKLKNKLQALGLFDPLKKKNLPRIPKTIGIISSSTGAALQDILSTLARRFPLAPIIVYACEVQGKQAALQLTRALQRANQEQRCDVLLLARGGGSIEDLWAFNDENLAYAIAASTIPIITGIGHETDFTIADFVADCRAATPTAAAETVSPHHLDLLMQIQTLEKHLLTSLQHTLFEKQKLLQFMQQKLSSPKPLIRHYWQALDHLEQQMQHRITHCITVQQHALHRLETRLQNKHPRVQLQQNRIKLETILKQLNLHAQHKIKNLRQTFLTCVASLQALSPLATLERGYAIATLEKKVLVNVHDVKINDVIDIRLAKGQIRGQVIAVFPEDKSLD